MHLLYGGDTLSRRHDRMRVTVIMACTECKQRNYTTNKNKKTNPDRMDLKKYCKFCRTSTVHRENR